MPKMSIPAFWALKQQARRRRRRDTLYDIPQSSSPWNGAAFVPPDCKLWLQSEAVQFGLGDSISIWGDVSGCFNNATQDTVSSQPTFQEVTFAGKTFKVVRFDTVDDGMVTPAVLPLDQPFSIFAVWRPSDLLTTCSIISSATENWMMGASQGGMICFFDDWTAGAAVNTDDFFLVEVRITPGQSMTWAYLNGEQTTPYGPGAGTTPPGQVALGGAGATQYPGGCDTPEIICYDRLLSDDEAWGVRRYLQDKYNFLKL